jgi:hypothetical protein
MEPFTQPPPEIDREFEALVAQIRDCYGRVSYTHSAHEKCADIYFRRLRRINFSQIILSALTTTSLLLALFGDTRTGTLVGALFATALLILNMYTRDNDLGKRAQMHVDVASKLWKIRESYLSVLTDMVSRAVSADRVREIRDALRDELAIIYSTAPRSDEGYKAAQKGLKVDEDLTFSDEELDRLLPPALRKTSASTAPVRALPPGEAKNNSD